MKNYISIIKKNIDYLFFFLWKKKMSYLYFKKQEKRKYGDKFPTKKFYVIRREGMGGIYSDIQIFVGHLLYADKHNLVPVIDRMNYINKWYQMDEDEGKINAWEMYFMQPSGYNLTDIKEASEVFLSNSADVYPWDRYDFTDLKVYTDDKFIRKINAIFDKYIHYNEISDKYIHSEYQKSIGDRKNILGVICRYGYNQLYEERNEEVRNHPKQPELDELIKRVEICMKEWKCEFVFLATDKKVVEEKFKKTFKEKLLLNSGSTFLENGIKGKEDERNIKYLRGLEYLANIYVLSRCDSIICGMNGGAAAAIVLNGGSYKNKYIYDLGRYEW